VTGATGSPGWTTGGFDTTLGGSEDAFVVKMADELGPDTMPPSPDPSTWATEPYAAGTTSIRMVATAASDPSGVEYYFHETSGNPGGTDSGWQDSNTYEDGGLSTGTTYTYQVKTRDKSANHNETSYSSLCSATPGAPDLITDVGAVTVLEGSTATFQVKLSAQPASDVTVTVSRVSGDSDITVTGGSSLTFTTLNWNTYQTVTLSAGQDVDATNGTATIKCVASGLPDKDVTAIEQDNNGTWPDLQPTAVGSSVWQSARPGRPVTWTMTVRNNGPGPQCVDWTAQWYLSSDQKYDATDTLVGSETYSDDIAKGASVSRTYTAPVPAVATAGQKYLIARVVNGGPDKNVKNDVLVGKDADWLGDVDPDDDEANETFETATDLGYVAGAFARDDRTLDGSADVDWYKFTTLGTAGKSQKVQISFANGEGDLALGLYRSNGSLIQEADKTGRSENVSLSGLAEGTYWIKVWSNHGDVSRNYRLTITAPSGPDLQPTAVDSSVWQSAEVGTQVDWMATIKNNGPGWQRADWSVQWYLSDDKKYQSSDTLIKTETYSDDIAPGVSVDKTYHGPVPALATAGQKCLIARVVNAGPDGKANNDVKVADADWFGQVGPDGDEANNTPETAVDLDSPTGTLVRQNLTIDSAEDVDWYKFTITRMGTSKSKVQIDFSNAEGDLALALYGSGEVPIQQVDKTGKVEAIKLKGLAAGTYYLKVLSLHGDISRNYKLTLVL
jgi:hypothetical protein